MLCQAGSHLQGQPNAWHCRPAHTWIKSPTAASGTYHHLLSERYLLDDCWRRGSGLPWLHMLLEFRVILVPSNLPVHCFRAPPGTFLDSASNPVKAPMVDRSSSMREVNWDRIAAAVSPSGPVVRLLSWSRWPVMSVRSAGPW